MTILTFLGTIDIGDRDTNGDIHLRLALDLLFAVRLNYDKKIIEAKARNIIHICCEPILDSQIAEHGWSAAQARYGDAVIARFTETATAELLQIACRRVAHQRKHERLTRLKVDDLRISVMIAYVMNVPDALHSQIDKAFLA